MKVAASPRIYMGRCPKWHVVTSHKSLETPNPWLLILAFKLQVDGFRVVVRRIHADSRSEVEIPRLRSG